MKFFVTGVNGQLGHDVMNELSKRGHEGVGSDLGETYAGVQDGSAVTTMPYVSLDITDQAAVKKQIMEIKPDAVIHCAAWTAVDAAEDEDKQATVKKVNVDGTRNIAEVCKALDCKMLYLSTDYVFDGQGTTPWEPDCKDYKPLNVYGQSKPPCYTAQYAPWPAPAVRGSHPWRLRRKFFAVPAAQSAHSRDPFPHRLGSRPG